MSKKDTDFNDNNNFDADDDFAMFRDAVKGVKKFTQDTIVQQPNRNAKQKEIRKEGRQASDSNFYFSDEFVPLLSEEGPTRYARDDVSKYEVKRLRRGVYVPDVFLDMHGMTQQEAKRELGSVLIRTAMCSFGHHLTDALHHLMPLFSAAVIPLSL